jgi:hypothetical protein
MFYLLNNSFIHRRAKFALKGEMYETYSSSLESQYKQIADHFLVYGSAAAGKPVNTHADSLKLR